jgi:hypothetical protein
MTAPCLFSVQQAAAGLNDPRITQVEAVCFK